MNDKLYKVLRIIFLALAIFSLVFTLAHKVGLCASGGGSGSDNFYPWSVPLPIAHDVGFPIDVPDSIKDYVVADIEDGITGSDNNYPYRNLVVGALLASEYDSSYNVLWFTVLRGTVVVENLNFDSNPSSSSILCNLRFSDGYCQYGYDLSNGSCYYFRNRSSSSGTFSVTQGYQMPSNELLPSGSSRLVVPKLSLISNYPVWAKGGSLYYDGTVVFTNSSSSGGGSSSEGLDDVIDMIDQIEDNPDVPQIDDSDPADISSPIGFLRKILTGIKKLGNYIISGFSSTINAIKNIALAIVQAIVDFYDFVRNNFYGLMQSFAQAFNNLLSSLPTWIQNVVTAVQNIYNWLYNTLDTLFGDLIAKIIDIVTYLHDLHDAVMDFIRNFFHGNNNNFVLTDILNGILGLPASIYSYFSSFITGFFTNLLDTLNDWLEDSEDHLPDWLKELKNIIHNIYTMGIDPDDSDHRFSLVYLLTNLFDFNTTKALSDFRNNKYGGFIISSKNWFSDFITALTGVQPSERVFFTLDLGTVFGNVDSPIPPIEIDFNWYAKIRDKFLPVFCAFLYVSCIWLFIKRLPDIIRGVAGDESSFMDGLYQNSDFVNTREYSVHGQKYVSTTYGHRSLHGTSSTVYTHQK